MKKLVICGICKGYIMPQAQKDKISKSNSGKVYNKTKINIVLDLMTGIFYEGINEAARSLGLNKHTLGNQLRNKRTPKNGNVRFAIV